MGRLEREFYENGQPVAESEDSLQEEARAVFEFRYDNPEIVRVQAYRANLHELQDWYVSRGFNRGLHELTTRRQTVLELTARGYSNEEIADQLFIECESVKAHNAKINRSYQTHTRLGRVLTGTILGDIDLVPTIEEDVQRRLGYQSFSLREWDIMRQLTAHFGKSSTNHEVAERIGLKMGTVSTILDRVKNKLGVTDRLEVGKNVFFAFVSTGDYEFEPLPRGTSRGVIFDISLHKKHE